MKLGSLEALLAPPARFGAEREHKRIFATHFNCTSMRLAKALPLIFQPLTHPAARSLCDS